MFYHSRGYSPICSSYLIRSVCYAAYPRCDSAPSPDKHVSDSKDLSHKFPPKSPTLCREDCELLQSSCSKEYAIALAHPQIGQQSLLNCTDSPVDSTEESSRCISLNIPTELDTNDNERCYWDNGSTYRGLINTSASGLSCLKWMHHFPQSILSYPELKGRHNYCRNPGGNDPQPWCYINVDGRARKQSCNISKCIDQPPMVSLSPERLEPRKMNQEGTCEVYTGKTCEQYVGNQTVYIPYPMTQKMLEDKLMQAFGVINISKDLSRNCAVYAKPSLCFSVFPICRENRFSTELFNLLHSGDQDETIDEENDGSDELSPPRRHLKRSPQMNSR